MELWNLYKSSEIKLRLKDYAFPATPVCSCLQTSYTLAWCLYNLARNPEVQEKLRSEVQSVVGSDEMVTPAHIHRMPYLRDCFKESHR